MLHYLVDMLFAFNLIYFFIVLIAFLLKTKVIKNAIQVA